MAALLFTLALPAQAAVFEAGENYSLPSTEIIDENLYIGAGNMAVSGNVEGDLIGAAGNVLITGEVSEDVLVAGGTVELLGNIGEDVRAAGGKITISKSIGQDLIVAGGVVTILEEVQILGDAVIAGGMVTFDGSIEKDAEIFGGDVIFNGTVIGDAEVTVDERFVVGPEAVIQGNLTYRSLEEITIPDTAVISGEVEFIPLNRVEAAGQTVATLLGSLFILKFILLFVAALVLGLVFKSLSEKIVKASLEPASKSFLTGLIVMIVTPVVALLLMATLIGIMLSFGLWFAFGLFLMLAKVYAAIVLGALIWRFASKDNKIEVNWKVILLGVFLTVVISLIPFVGWAINAVIMLMALGGLSLIFYTHVWLKGR